MKIPMILNKGNKRYSFIQKCNENLFLYEDQFGIKITFTRFDLKGIDKSLDGHDSVINFLNELENNYSEQKKELNNLIANLEYVDTISYLYYCTM